MAADQKGEAFGVLALTKCLGLGGVERLLALMAKKRERDSYRFAIAYVNPCDHAYVEELEAEGLEVFWLGNRGVRRWPHELARLLRSRRFAIIHSHSPLPGAVARIVGPSDGLSFVHTEHSLWDSHHVATRAVNELTLGRNAHCFAVSEAVKQSMSTSRAGPRIPIEVLYHGFDSDRVVNKASATTLAARRELSLDADAYVVGAVGGLRREKSYQTLVESFALLKRRVPNAQLVIVGDGAERERIAHSIRRLELSGATTLAGSRLDVPSLLPAFDVFASTSSSEGLPVSIWEAMACGLPVVTTDAGGNSEVVEDGRTGYVVPVGGIEAHAARLTELALDSATRRAMGESGRALSTTYSAHRAIARMEDVYRTIAGGQETDPNAGTGAPR